MSIKKTNLMARRKTWFLLSLAIIIPGIFSLLFQGLNVGIDFTGGNLWHIEFKEETNPQEIRGVLSEFDLEGSQIQDVTASEYVIRTTTVDRDVADDVWGSLENNISEFDLLRNEFVGPVIGKELTTRAAYALLIAAVVMVAYISYRFEFSFAIAAIIAILHDVLVTISVFSIFQIEVNSAFVAAILTVIGYSINDTIVIFDRIRENLRYKDGGKLADLVNRSVWETMGRSINTGMTIVFVLIALLVFGGDTLKPFILALLIGVISGVYSSVFTASPAWLEIKKIQNRRKV